jgi:hypothetical protein
MPERVPQSVARREVFQAVLSADHVTPATGKTIAVTLSKNGSSFGSPAAGALNATEIAHGFYYADLGATDYNTQGPLIIRMTQADIDPVALLYTVVDAETAGFGAIDYDAVKAQVVAALHEDLYDLPGQEDLPTSTPLSFMLRWLYKLNRNRATQTADLFKLYNQAETEVDQQATVSQDSTTFVRGRFQQGP